MEYKKYKIEEFLQELSSTKSMPGGGTASALVGANAVNLMLKVCNLTIGKEKYKENEKLVISVRDNLLELNDIFLSLMDEDAKEFKAIEEVFKMPNNTLEEKENRKIAMEEACKKCCNVPKQIIIEANKTQNLLNKIKGKVNKSAESDIYVAEIFIAATLAGAYENIKINLKYIRDEEFKKQFEII